MFKILLEQFLIPPLRPGSEGGGGKESGWREESREGRREGGSRGGREETAAEAVAATARFGRPEGGGGLSVSRVAWAKGAELWRGAANSGGGCVGRHGDGAVPGEAVMG